MRRMAAAVLLLLPLTSSALAQSTVARSAMADGEPVDVSRLPLNLERIQRELRQSTIREERHGLNLRYVVEVYGQAPPLILFGPDDDLVYGPVPYGAPTHKEMIEHVTPKEYRAPAADFSALLRWLAERAKK